MDVRDKLEIYVPAEAEVKSIPLRTLPNSVLRRMGLPSTDFNGSKKLPNAPKAVWICPVVVRRKGQKSSPHADSTLWFLDREFRATSGPFRMSFVLSNPAAYKVLKDAAPGNRASPHVCHGSLPQGSASRSYQTAVVVYAGRIYLSVRKPSQRREQQSAPCSSALPTPSSSRSQKKELLNIDKPKKSLNRWKVANSENKTGVKQKVRDAPSSKTRPVPQSTVDARGDQSTEDAIAPEQDWLQPQEEAVANDSGEGETQNPGCEEPDRAADHSGDTGGGGGEVEQSGTHGWIRREPVGGASASTSALSDCDFKELAHEEKIAQTKARLRQSEAAVNNFPST